MLCKKALATEATVKGCFNGMK
uniref:Uncharacterized protein n=1 Tax=Arundo donax TaxID=35708 RepID=A0A0A8Z3Q2_ARUDO